MVPFDLSFGVVLSARGFFKVLDILIDLVFVADIILMFFTAAVNKRGVETKDANEIKNLYIGTVRFKTDILSIFGADIFGNLW